MCSSFGLETRYAPQCYLRWQTMTTGRYSMISISKRSSTAALLAFLQASALQAATVLENDYVRVSRDEAPCARRGTPGAPSA